MKRDRPSFTVGIEEEYFIVDRERRIVDFNRAFFAMLPRQMARGLKGKRCFTEKCALERKAYPPGQHGTGRRRRRLRLRLSGRG